MANVEFELNLSGLQEIMKSGEMQSALSEAGAAVAQAAGGDYAYRVHTASFVSLCNVYPDSKEAAKENYETNSLLKAAGAVGLPMSK
jgi:hypothetical protein